MPYPETSLSATERIAWFEREHDNYGKATRLKRLRADAEVKRIIVSMLV